MSLHCITVLYEPNTFLSSRYIPTWLTNWTRWVEEDVMQPQTITKKDFDNGTEIEVDGFEGNRFEIRGSGINDPLMERDIILNGLTRKLEEKTAWSVVKWHHCVHDDDTRTVERTDSDGNTYTEEVSGCGSWEIVHQHGDVPSEVNL